MGVFRVRLDFESATTHVHNFSPSNCVQTSRSIHEKLISALRTVSKSRICSRRFDHKGDWAMESSDVIISLSKMLRKAHARKFILEDSVLAQLVGAPPARAAHRLSWTTRLGSNKAVLSLAKQESVGRVNFTLLAVVCQAWRHFLSR